MRPITLLNLSYKILAKALAGRIAPLVSRFISKTQTRFIQGRYVLENLITNWEAMHWAKENGQEVAMILLDFEKTYDRIEWCFVIGMLKAFGFPNKYCDWISILFNETSTVIDVNGNLSEPIRLQRSIR